MADGEIWTGEAKSTGQYFTAEQLRHDVEISKVLRAANHIMACLDTLPEEVVGQALVIFRRENIRLWTLEGVRGNLQNRQ